MWDLLLCLLGLEHSEVGDYLVHAPEGVAHLVTPGQHS